MENFKMNNIDLKKLCRDAIRKMGLDLVFMQTKVKKYWKVKTLWKAPYRYLPWASDDHDDVEVECDGKRNVAIEMSIEEIANSLLNRWNDGVYRNWKIFHFLDIDGNVCSIENIFAGKSYEEAMIMIDLL